jgi:hypothetical protein
LATLRPAEVKAIRFVELRWVPIRRADNQIDQLPPADAFASQLDLLCGRAVNDLHWDMVAQYLLHSGVDERGLIPQFLHLVSVLK